MGGVCRAGAAAGFVEDAVDFAGVAAVRFGAAAGFAACWAGAGDVPWARPVIVIRMSRPAVTECRRTFKRGLGPFWEIRCAVHLLRRVDCIGRAVLLRVSSPSCPQLAGYPQSLCELDATRTLAVLRGRPRGKLVCMRVFGIDCGTEFTGYGVVEVDDTARIAKLRPLCAGAVRLNKKDRAPVRLLQVYVELSALLQLWQPEVVAIEEVFFSANAKSALKLGQVRGVAMLAAANCGLLVAEYAPLTIKSSVVGYGLAAKEQVQFMVARLLDLEEAPKPADAADALAIAICHIHHAQTAEHMRR